ncbi:CHAT domain-containing protein, partial [Mycena leptocephala]
LNQHGNSQDVDEAIARHRETLGLHAAPHPKRGMSLNNLASALRTRFQQCGDSQDIEEAIAIHREGLVLHAVPHPCRGSSLNNLANALSTRFEQRGDSQDIDEAIGLYREGLVLHSAPHPDRGMSLSNLASALNTRFEQHGDSQDIDEAIGLYRERLGLHSAPHTDCGMSLSNLASALRTRFEQHGDSQDIEEAIALHREALVLHAVPHPNRGSSLNNLASALGTRSQQAGDHPQDLDEAIALHREALVLHAAPHPGHSSAVNNLATTLQTRFWQCGDSQDMDEAIALHREVLVLRAAPHPDRGMSLSNLASALRTRFEQRGESQDIEEAIALQREALLVDALPHPNHGLPLNNLASALQTRFQHHGDSQDIEEAIALHREALVRHAVPHPNRRMSLNNLATTLQARFEQCGDSRDIVEAIALHREALVRCAPPHPDRGSSLNNLATALQTRFKHHGDSQDIDEAIALHREALVLLAVPHPNRSGSLANLAAILQARFRQCRDSQDIGEAIALRREALALDAAPHPDHDNSLLALGSCLLLAHTDLYPNHGHNLNHAFEHFQEAATYLSSSPLTRLRNARSWGVMATEHKHPSSLAAYGTAIELLPQLAALHLDLPSRRQILSSANGTTLASDAASCAVSLGQYNTAVEFLEASRSVFWSQALYLRTPLDDLSTVRPDLSDSLTDLSRKLEQASFRDISRNLATDHQDRAIAIESEGLRCRQLNKDWEQVIQTVRTLPRFEDFMRPKGISALQRAAVSGPVIILSATKSTGFALIVTVDREVQYLRLLDMVSPTARLFGGREGIIDRSSDEVFQGLLAHLWNTVVKPVFEALDLKKSADPPRLWWCPIGPLAFLPIHAAGIYGRDITDCASDYVVSSYTPTITGLLDRPTHAATPFKMTAVVQPKAKGCDPLPGVQQELEKIAERVPKNWLTALRYTTVQTALTHLRESSIVHFACHGVQDSKQPLDSGLILTDGRLKVSEIMRRPKNDSMLDIKKSMSLAFLSACETAKGDEAVPDEAMHLAATLLFAGFRGVVATMWTMNDLDGPKIADTFYEQLFKDCDPNSSPPVLPDLTNAAKGLHLAVAKLRKDNPNIPFQRWVPFVHYG